MFEFATDDFKILDFDCCQPAARMVAHSRFTLDSRIPETVGKLGLAGFSLSVLVPFG